MIFDLKINDIIFICGGINLINMHNFYLESHFYEYVFVYSFMNALSRAFILNSS